MSSHELPPSRGPVRVVLGPTNTGKTHLAVERMLGHATGIIGLPLRLLAREIYDRISAAKGPRRVALVTGEEKIVPPHPQWFVCTVEAMPLDRSFEFLAIDEIQLMADAERGHVFTERLLHARGTAETMFMGADTVRHLIKRLVPGAEFETRERLSHLSYAGPKKLSRLPRRSAIVAFSSADVYGIAELVRHQRGGAAVVMGALSPRTRNAQVAMYQSGEVDFLVATDAIGMGLNMDVDHVAFAATRKFDGVTARSLTPSELGQIAGRAGRNMNNGTFGTTAEIGPLEPDMVEKIENHRFDPVVQARWRNRALEFRDVGALLRSLDAPPPMEGLVKAREAEDYMTLRALAPDREVIERVRHPGHVRLLWQVCQIPDFRKTLRDAQMTYNCMDVDDAGKRTNCQSTLAKPYQQKAFMEDALSKAKDRVAQINSLMRRAGATTDQKEIQEVTARIGAENALLQHEVSQIELMRGLAEADQRVADSRAREGQLEQASRNRRLADFIRD